MTSNVTAPRPRASKRWDRRRLVAASLLASLGVALVPESGSSAHPLKGVVAPATWSSCPAPSVGANYEAPGSSARTVALTFDDGPGPSTAQILAILSRFHVRATFFNIGIDETRWPHDVRAEAAGGFLIGDHTWTHPVLTSLSPAQQLAQLAAVGAEQRSLVGSSPCSFRPPYGDFDSVTSSEAASLSMSIWMWNVDTEDWKADGSASSYWVQRIISLAESEGGDQNHPVILMHNQSIPMPATVAALPSVIEYFLAHHYTFVDLLGRSGPPNACSSAGARFAPSPSSSLSGGVLDANQALSSPDDQYRLTQDANGTLALQSGARLLWSTPTRGHRGARTIVAATGRLEVETPSGAVLWRSSGGHRGDHLSLNDDGTLALTSARAAWWTLRAPTTSLGDGHGLAPGWMVSSANGACRLVMTASGQLRLLSAAEGTLWTSRSDAVAGASVVLESNGDLEVLAPDRRVLWASGSLGPSARLTISPVGHAIVTNPSGRWLWSSP